MKSNVYPKQYNFNRFCNWILELTLNPKQHIHACNLSRESDFIYRLQGKRQEGRSTIGLSYGLYRAYIEPNIRVGIICRNYAMISLLTSNRVMNRIKSFAKNFNKERYDFINGSSIHFSTNKDDLRRRGMSFDYIIIDDMNDNEESYNLARLISPWCKQLVVILHPDN